MYNITLISTVHSEKGKCNSEELYKIIESINPELVFDELPSHYCDMYYSDTFDKYCANNILRNQQPVVVPLEVKCIKKYKQNFDIKIFPVDIDISQKLSKHQSEISCMFLTFFKNEDYIILDNQKDTFIEQGGFHYLNSDTFLDYLEKKEVIEKNIMESEFHRNRLLDIYKLFHAEQNDNRENEMLKNIYNYSKGNQYNQAVFLIGAEHKKSIMQKIKEYEKKEKLKLNWAFYK